MDYSLLALLMFVVLTTFRQVHYFWHQSKQKKVHLGNHILQKKDRLGSYLMSILYVVIWFSAIYKLYISEFVWIWYLLGLLLVLAGFVVRIKALQDLGKNYGHEIIIWADHKLVTHGIYSWVRHPLYLALLIELLGMVIIGREFWILIVWLLLVVVMIRRISLEDKVLLVLGGSARQYQMTVPAINVFAWLLQKKRRTNCESEMKSRCFF